MGPNPNRPRFGSYDRAMGSSDLFRLRKQWSVLLEISWIQKINPVVFRKKKSCQHKPVWWLNQPIWKILVKLDHFPNFRGENKKKWIHHLETLHLHLPTSFARGCNPPPRFVAGNPGNSTESLSFLGREQTVPNDGPPRVLYVPCCFFRWQQWDATKTKKITLASGGGISQN